MAVLWVVTPCSLVEVYQRFGGPCCLHHQGDDIMMEAARTSETSVNFCQATRSYNTEDSHLRYSPPWEPQILHNLSCWISITKWPLNLYLQSNSLLNLIKMYLDFSEVYNRTFHCFNCIFAYSVVYELGRVPEETFVVSFKVQSLPKV
jgi:hypothetical protein